MNNIFHYSYVKEDFTKELEILHEIEEAENANEIDCVFGDVPVSPKMIKTVKKDYKTVNITADELKGAMSANEGLTITRETFAVSEDTDKDTISIKRYYFQKKFVAVKYGKRKRWKILHQAMSGITVNKITGEYYVYSSKRFNKNNIKTYIRKSIMTQQIKNLLASLVAPIAGQSMREGQVIFYEKLGFRPLIGYDDFITYYMNPRVEIDPIPRNSIVIMPFINYLSSQGIRIPEYHELHLFELLFKRDKKLFYKNGSGIHEIIRAYYGIKDDRIISKALSQLYYDAPLHYTSEVHKANEAILKHKHVGSAISHLCLDGFTLRLSSKYQLTHHDLSQLNLVVCGYDNDGTMALYDSKMLDLYNFHLTDINKHSLTQGEMFKGSCSLLYYFYLFGIKLRFRTIDEIRDNYETINKLFDALCHSRSQTGTVMINEKFMQKMKKKLDPTTVIGIHHNLKVKTNSQGVFSQVVRSNNNMSSLNEPKGYKRSFNEDEILPWFYIKINETQKLNFRLSFKEGHTQMKGSNNHSSMPVHFLMKELSDNKKNVLKDLEIKQIYSKRYFEETCLKYFGINAQEYIEYL